MSLASLPVVGIEFGSTRIKAVAIDGNCRPVASGAHEWENALQNGVWTYSLADAAAGLQDAFARLKADYAEKTGTKLCRLGALGISGMMHGYLPFDREGRQLCEFRTWLGEKPDEGGGKRHRPGGDGPHGEVDRGGADVRTRPAAAGLYLGEALPA